MRAVALVGALVLAAAGSAAGYAVGRAQEPETVTTTLVQRSTDTVTSTAPTPGLPPAVERTRAAIVAAALARDYDALRQLIPSTGFTFSYGASDDPIAYWKQAESRGEDPLRTLATILDLPYDLAQGHYVWPFAYSLRRSEMTPYERELLGELADAYAGDSYLGHRVGIDPEGRWVFFVAGD